MVKELITEWKDEVIDEKMSNTTLQSENLTRTFRNLAMNDRDVMDSGVRAFVSFVRAYKCHILKHIFSFENLDLGYLAMMFGLLQLPKMPELKDSDTLIGYTEMKDVDIDSIPYKNKHREKQRRKQLKIRKKEEQEKKKRTTEISETKTKSTPRSSDAITGRKTRRRNVNERERTKEWSRNGMLYKKRSVCTNV